MADEGTKILFVDEMGDVGTEYMLAHLLSREGYAAYFMDFQSARASMDREDYRLVIVDPETRLTRREDALAFIKSITKVPVVLYTNRMLHSVEREDGLKMGDDYDAFLSKDADFHSEMRRTIDRLVKG